MRDPEFIEKVKKYLSSPEAIGKAVRGKDSLRESLVFQLIAEKINSLSQNDTLSILDVGCGKAPILMALKSEEKLKKYTSNISYHGRDTNLQYINELRCLESDDREVKWAKDPYFTIGEILDYRPGENELYDIIIALNCIHEFDPADIPEIFQKLNSLLKADGTIVVIDMEMLPPGEEEVQSVCFNRSEIEKILESLGIKNVPITHKKTVDVFCLQIHKFDHNIDEKICIETINSIIEKKLKDAMREYKIRLVSTEREWDNDYIYEWVCLTSYICRLVRCLQNIKSKFDNSNNMT